MDEGLWQIEDKEQEGNITMNFFIFCDFFNNVHILTLR